MPDAPVPCLPAPRFAGGVPRISEILARLGCGDPGSRVSIGDIVAALDEKAFGLLTLVFTLPNGLPGPAIPGMSAVFGVPIILLGLQMLRGREEPWLPRILLRQSFRRSDFARVLVRARPVLMRIERLFRPRPGWLVSARGERLIGLLVVVYGFVLALPIPLGNLPAAWGIILMSLGLIEANHRAALVGGVIGAAAVGWNVFIVLVGWEALTEWLPALF